MSSRAYKIVDIIGEIPYTLFHGVHGSRKLDMNRWMRSESKMVHDGTHGTPYMSGWHVLKSVEDCIEYLKLFKHVSNKAIIECSAHNVRPKEHSPHPVFLADAIRLDRVVWQHLPRRSLA